ncbi:MULTISPECIES: DUF1223 domain-containing protein [Shimia]|uniref:DUF1223 domain-containing protein n=1 Tax=Shimia TaxID=573139 RepID=UPI001FB49C5A|nr:MULTISPECIES: DUF1223 domain-containing protein [Shimia]MDV4145542.1 DUF1223 domain-containing protein [Shimia sp. FJ5]
MKSLFALMTFGWLALAGSMATAQSGPVVVELFTSQGCSSCPPADAYFAKELAGREDVIALALHVDYWDYLGWKDNFANPAFTKRQKQYARASGHRMVYTPQIIVGGRDHVVGNHPKEVKALLKSHRAAPSAVRVNLKRVGGRVEIKASASETPGAMVVHLVRYEPEDEVAIKRGENAGRKLVYANIVTDWHVVAEWDGRAPLQIEAPAAGDAPVVALVQGKGNGPIFAADRIE